MTALVSLQIFIIFVFISQTHKLIFSNIYSMINIYTFVQRKHTYFLPLIALLLTNTIFCKTTEVHLPTHQMQEVVKKDKIEQQNTTESEQKIPKKEKERTTEDKQKVDKKGGVDVKTQSEQAKDAVKEDSKTTTKPKQPKKSTLSNKKKKPEDKIKTGKATKEAEASVEVNETELLIKKRLFKFIQNEPWQSQLFFKTLTHPIFFPTYNKLLGNLTHSLEHHPSLLNETSIRDINLFAGNLANPRYHLVNKLCETIDLKLLPAKLGLVFSFAALNNDTKRIKRYRKYIEGFKQHPKAAFAMKRIYDQAPAVYNDLIMFLGRDHIPFRITQAIANLINIDRDPILLMLKTFGRITAEDIEQMELGAGWNKFFRINMTTVEAFSEAELHLGNIARVLNTLWWLLSWLPFNLGPDFAPNTPTLLHPGLPSTRLPYRFINLFAKRANAFWSWLTGRGASLHHVFTGGADRNSFRSNDINNPTTWSISNLFNKLTFPLAWAYHCVMGTVRSIMRLIMLYQEVKNLLIHWQKVTIILQKFLKNIAKFHELTVKTVNIIKANPALAKALSGPILDKLKAFVNDEEFESIIKPITKILYKKDENPTLMQMFMPWYRPALLFFTTYKKLEGMSEESKKLFKESAIAFPLLNVYQALGTHVYMSEKDLVKDKICLVDIKEQKSPALSLKGLYTPLTKGEKVLNDFSIGIFGADKKQGSMTFVEGENGSGKTTLLFGIDHCIAMAQAFELGFAEKASMVHIDKLYSLGGSSGNMAEGKSSFMGNVTSMIKLREEIEDACKTGEKIVMTSDEFMGGKTNYHEASILKYVFWKEMRRFFNVNSIISTHNIKLRSMAKKEKYNGFNYVAMGHHKDTGMPNFKVVTDKNIERPASLTMLDHLGFPKKLTKEVIRLLKKEPEYPFRHLLQGEDRGISMNAWIDILIVLFFVIGGVVIIYRRRIRLSSKQEQTRSSEK